jgi:hypothetical protein
VIKEGCPARRIAKRACEGSFSLADHNAELGQLVGIQSRARLNELHGARKLGVLGRLSRAPFTAV